MNARGRQEAPQARMTVSVEEAARILGISRGSAYEAVRKKEIPSLQIGRRVLVPLVPLRRLLGETDQINIEEPHLRTASGLPASSFSPLRKSQD
jgi:excisionase family DNA binding protein